MGRGGWSTRVRRTAVQIRCRLPAQDSHLRAVRPGERGSRSTRWKGGRVSTLIKVTTSSSRRAGRGRRIEDQPGQPRRRRGSPEPWKRQRAATKGTARGPGGKGARSLTPEGVREHAADLKATRTWQRESSDETSSQPPKDGVGCLGRGQPPTRGLWFWASLLLGKEPAEGLRRWPRPHAPRFPHGPEV